MTKAEFLDTLGRRLAGLPRDEIDEMIADYAAHFDEGLAAGRSEAEIAAALGDPVRLAGALYAMYPKDAPVARIHRMLDELEAKSRKPE